ncbi:BppU family phage baseplate upper protein (plasmid) [Clostridium perfringens]|uniref:BppU family phage baseplate upper protein n=1 Tax=Clostridium perfringens TaxID=1502 RepID=UPI0030CA8775
MSEIGLNINVDSYNNEGIKTIKGNNNAEIYKLYILKNKRRLSLVGKTVKLGYVMAGTTNGNVIENLNITNAEQGEITFPITNRISKQDGVYSCQLAILGEGDFLEHTATFTLTVENNIFSDITKAIADSKDFTYLENILDKASKLSEKLKENTSSATNANSNLESNITEANNINSKLLENTSAATGLNKNLESNIDLAKEVKETIKDLDTKNIEATEKIERLEGLNAKAEELSNNINEALPVKDALVKNTEEAKTANTNLAATNQEAVSKNTELQASLEKTKEFIEGLDGSQNIPQIRLDVDALQNGLKSNQALAYKGSSINAENTLEGRTEGMRIGGRTLVNLVKYRLNNQKVGNPSLSATLCTNEMFKTNTTYTIIYTINSIESGTGKTTLNFSGGMSAPDIILNSSNLVGTHKQTFTLSTMPSVTHRNVSLYHLDRGTVKLFSDVLIIEGEVDFVPNYFEGIKSFGEAEQEGDKYKISILSSGKNFFKSYKSKSKGNTSIFNIENDNVTIGTNQSPSWTNASINYGKLKIGSKYTVSCEGFSGGVGDKVLFAVKKYKGRDEVGAYGDINKNSLSLTFTVVDDADIVLRFFVNNTTPINTPTSITYNNIQIVEGIKTNYAPSIIDKKDILISAPLRSVYDVQDIMYEDNGQVKVNRVIGEHLVTGDENFITELRNDYLYGYFTLEGSKAGSGLEAICNQFKYIDGLWNKDNLNVQGKEGFDLSGSNSLSFQLPISKLETADTSGLKKYFKNLYNSNNPVIVYYQLATPTIEIVENCVDIDLDTYQEKTYFNILNSLPGTLDFKVPSNIGSVVQNMAKEVNNIWDVINNLLVPSILDVNKKVALATIKNNLK